MKASTAQQRSLPRSSALCPWWSASASGYSKPEYIRLLYTDDWQQVPDLRISSSEIVGILVIRKLANPKF